jgi:hypothetical protein
MGSHETGSWHRGAVTPPHPGHFSRPPHGSSGSEAPLIGFLTIGDAHLIFNWLGTAGDTELSLVSLGQCYDGGRPPPLELEPWPEQASCTPPPTS